MVEPDVHDRSPDQVGGGGGGGDTPKPGKTAFAALIDDQRARWLRGEPVAVEHYLEHVPSLSGREDTILDLIYNEVVLREEVGEAPQLDEYQRRFPHWAPQLAVQFEVHRAITAPSATVDDTSGAGARTSPDSSHPSRGREAHKSTVFDPDQSLAEPTKSFETTIEFNELEDLIHLARPATGDVAKRPALPRIPGYEVLGELGRGGMGVVYLARQVRLNRPCALKTILAGDHAAPEVALRFLAEAETVARLRHPNIVQIHAIGDHEGRPYIELEYVEGGSLAGRLDGTPWIPKRATQLVETIARVVHDAHSLGVVHRDLKPANVLMAAEEIPKLTDFGLAKSLNSDSGLTRTESILGSPSYMAPEQAGGGAKRVGPAADIYALGAILYELLTGRPPFRAATVLETLEQVRSTEAVPPSRLQPGLPRDLETITLKCLDKDPQRRYATAMDLADDLRRSLNGEPIRAQAIGPLGRGLKWVRRRPLEAALLAVTGVAVLSLTWAVAASRYEHNLARKNRELDAALEDAQRHRGRAKRSFDQARDVVDHFISLIEQRLDEPHLKAARNELLADGLAYYQGVLQQWEDTPELQFELIRTYTGVAKVADALGSKAEALKAYEQALAILEKLVKLRPDVPRYRLDLAEVEHSLGILYSDTGQIDLALRSFEAGRSIRDRLSRESPGDPRIMTDLARSHGYIGDLLLDAGRLDEAESAYRRSHAIREKLAAGSPRDTSVQFQLARSFINLARLGRQKGQLDQASSSYRRALAIIEPLDASGAELRDFRTDLAWTCNLLGALLLEPSPPMADEALSLLRRGNSLYERSMRDQPGVPDHQSGLGRSHLEIGKALMAMGKPAEALVACLEARDVYDRLVKENAHVTEYLCGLAMSCDAVGSLQGPGDEARASLMRARTILEQLVAEDPAKLEYRSNLGQVLADYARSVASVDPAGAVNALKQAVAEQEAVMARAPNVVLYRRRLDDARAALVALEAGPTPSP